MRCTRVTKYLGALLAVVLLAFAAGCSSDDDSSSSDTSVASSEDGTDNTTDDDAANSDTGDNSDDEADETDDSADNDANDPSEATGSLVIDGMAAEVGSPRCWLEPQDAAAGGGKILATAQVSGTNADGEDVLFDFTRFDEDSRFHGDTVDMNVGPIADGISYHIALDEGAVEINNDVVMGENITLNALDAGEDIVVSFELHC